MTERVVLGVGTAAIPIAFAVTASIETPLLGTILALRLRRRANGVWVNVGPAG